MCPAPKHTISIYTNILIDVISVLYSRPEARGVGMSRLLSIIEAVLLAGCSAAPQSAPQPAAVAAPDTGNVTRKLQNHWHQCLEQSYRTARTNTPDKNVA